MSFKQVSHWFNKLVELTADEQQEQITQLLDSKVLTEPQCELLKQMLDADKQQSLPEKVVDLKQPLLPSDSDVQLSKQPMIGAYRLLRLIGSGGMGHVYLAARDDGSYEQQVAIKLSQQHFDDKSVKRFQNERQILAQLRHPHIAQLLDGGTASSQQPYLVMEYIKGQSISQYCIDHHLGLRDRLRLLLQVCQAVSFAHQNLVLHRDLKPDNILVDEAGQVKLLDFGIAKLLSEDANMPNQTMTQIMTRNYASPEQIKGELVGTQSDLFSLAVIAYELVTGFHPFDKKSLMERDQDVLSGKVKRITQLTDPNQAVFPELILRHEKIKGDLENILIKALSTAPAHRYGSVESFAEDIKNFIHLRPVTARKPSRFYSLIKLIQRQKAAFVIISLLSIGLISATTLSVIAAREAEVQRQIAVTESGQAKQIATFLTGVFTSAKPRSDKDELTARDLLTQGFVDIKSQLQNNPEQRFELIAVMLDSLESLSYFDSIFNYVDELYPECVLALSEQNRYCQQLLITAGDAAIGTQQDQLALTYLQQAEKIARKAPINQALLVEILRIQFNAYINLKQFEQAVKTTDEALLYYQNTQHSPIDIINIKSDLAVLATHQGQYAAAKKYYDSMTAMIESNSDIDTDSQVLFYANYSFFFAKQKLFKQAIAQRQKGILILQHAYSRPSFSLAWEQESLAKLYFFAGELAAGIEAAKAALQTFESLDSEADKHVYELNLFIAQMQVLSGDVDAAQQIISLLSANNWDKRCVYTLVKALIAVYAPVHSEVGQSVEDFEACVLSASYPTKYADEFLLLLKAERLHLNNQSTEAKTVLEQLFQYWQSNPKESLPIQSKARLLNRKLK